MASGEVNVKREGEPGSIFTPEAQIAFFTEVRNQIGPPIMRPDPTSPVDTATAPDQGSPSDDPALNSPSDNLADKIEPDGNGKSVPNVFKPIRKAASPRKAPRDRPCLFGPRRNSSPGITIPESQLKAQAIVVELRQINPHENPLATTMLLRALLELSNNYYRRENTLGQIDSLHKSIANTSDHMKASGKLSSEQHDLIMGYTRVETSLLHIKTIQACIHNDGSHPNGQFVNTIWDEIGCFVAACWL